MPKFDVYVNLNCDFEIKVEADSFGQAAADINIDRVLNEVKSILNSKTKVFSDYQWAVSGVMKANEDR